MPKGSLRSIFDFGYISLETDEFLSFFCIEILVLGIGLWSSFLAVPRFDDGPYNLEVLSPVIGCESGFLVDPSGGFLGPSYKFFVDELLTIFFVGSASSFFPDYLVTNVFEASF